MSDDFQILYVPPQSPLVSSPLDDINGDHCMFDDDDDVPFLAYEKEVELVADAIPSHTDAASQVSDYHWHPMVRLQDLPTLDQQTLRALNSNDTAQNNKKDIWTSTGDICYVHPKLEFNSPYNRRRTTTAKKDRTPRTALKMMEKHRENERTRHHNLNDNLNDICKKVPGACQDGRETKVVMMQRIISYVAYLENTIVNLCGELGIDPDRITSLTPLTLQLRKEVENRNLYGYHGDYPQEVTEKRKKSITIGRLKLSSPTIDSTSDHQVPDPVIPKQEKQDASQDSMVPTSTFIPLQHESTFSSWGLASQEEVIETSEYDPLLSQASDNCMNFPQVFLNMGSPKMASSQASFQTVPSSLSLLSSPSHHDNKENISAFNLGGNILNLSLDERLGSEKDASFDPEGPNTLSVCPENILPTVQIPSSSSAFFSPVQSSSLHSSWTPSHSTWTPGQASSWTPSESTLWSPDRINKRKQNAPKRSPFSNLSNFSEDVNTNLPEEPFNFDDGSDEVTENSLQNLGLTRHQKAKIALLQACDQRPSSSQSEGSRDVYKKSGKTDLRKASWMNGFMMFSRLNRRSFINANPGVHTSNISKIMGHAWRNMSSEEQNPYREKAKLCAQELQKQQELPDDFCTDRQTSTDDYGINMHPYRSLSADPCVGGFNLDH